jgi:hypothetical protein
LILVSVGYGPAEVRKYSLPKLKLLSELAREMKLQDALELSAAVWNPKTVTDELDYLQSSLGAGRAKDGDAPPQCETPRSVEEWERMTQLKANG